MTTIFPFSTFWPIYLLFTLIALVFVAVDLRCSKASINQGKRALIWSIVWIVFGLVVAVGVYALTYHILQGQPQAQAQAWQITMEYLAGYVVEKSLAIDNLFVILLLFSTFKIPHELQHRVLLYGILGAIVFRAAFIALGAYIFDIPWVFTAFGILLIISGFKMVYKHDQTSGLVTWIERLSQKLPLTSQLRGPAFFIKQHGRWVATPLFMAMLGIELCDIVFAIDSIPAIFALTKEPFVVYTSNVCAILGLRALYLALASLLQQFHLLHYGLAGILIFVGSKMVWLNPMYGGHFPIEWSMAIISSLLMGSMLASYWNRPANHS